MDVKKTVALCALLAAGCLDKSGGTMTPQEVDPVVREAALSAFAGCMTKANWDTSNMGAWATKTVEGGTVCSSCHGQRGFYVATEIDSEDMFNSNRMQLFIGAFFAVDAKTEEVVGAYDKLDLKGGGVATHPTFATGQGDTHYEYLETFVQLTNQAKADGACAASGFYVP